MPEGAGSRAGDAPRVQHRADDSPVRDKPSVRLPSPPCC